MLTNKQICLTVIGLYSDWQAHLDACLRTVHVLGVGPCTAVVDVANHIDDFAADGNFFTSRFGGLAVFFALVGERRKHCKSNRGDE